MIRILALLYLALMLAAPLAACGKIGDPTLPPGQSDDFPRKYPAPY